MDTVGEDAAGRTLVGVVGAGTMGAGIAQVAVTAGHPVVLYDAAPGAADVGARRVLARLDRALERAELTAAERDAARQRLQVVDDLGALARVGLVIEAIAEDVAAKRALFGALERVVGEDTILASNTSSISITALAAGLEHPGRLVGMHFFNPAPVMRLVEIVSGLTTRPAVAERAASLARSWHKTPVRCRSTPGFVVNRVARPYYGEALRAYEEGIADFATIDAVMRESGGFRMGPFELMDLIGIDVNLDVSTSVWQATSQDPRYAPSWTQREYVAAGWLGRKTGRGFYDHAKGAPVPSPSTEPGRAAPARVRLEGGGLGPAEVLLPLLRDAGIAVTRDATADPAGRAGSGVLRLPSGTTLRLTDGAPAGRGRVLFDLASDYAAATRIALSAGADTPGSALDEAIGLFQALGKQVTVLNDVPGMLVAATVARLVNEAADAVARRDVDEDGVDAAMRLGVNYPRGPVEWGRELGARWVVTVLRNLESLHPTSRFRVSPLLRAWGENGA